LLQPILSSRYATLVLRLGYEAVGAVALAID